MESDDCLIVSENIKPSSKKKLKVQFPLKTKQALLSFAPLSSKQKKEIQQKKTGNSNSVSSLPSESRSEKKRKLSGPVEDNLPSAKKPASAKQSRYSPAADAEVSSSCDEVSIASPPAAQDKPPRSGGLLQHFVRREPTQQAEISTSVLDDKDSNGCSSTSPEVSLKDDLPSEKEDVVNGCGQKHETPKAKRRTGGKAKKVCNGDGGSDSSAKAVEESDKVISEVSLSSAAECSVQLERLSPELSGSIEELDSEVPRKKIKLDSSENDTASKTTPRERRSSLGNKTVKTNDKGNLLTAFLKRGSPRVKETETKTLPPVPKTKPADKLDDSVDLSLSNVETEKNTASDSVCVGEGESEGADEKGESERAGKKGESEGAGKKGESEGAGEKGESEGAGDVSKAEESCDEANSSSSGTPSSKASAKPLQKLTPKTLAKQLEKKKKREQEREKKQQEKLELKRQKEEEKAKKEEERLRLKKEKEDELKRQREEKEQLKEERNRKKQEEIEAKNKEREEKRLKLEEEKRAKEEERLKKEEEKQRKEEEKRAKEEEKKRLEQEEEDRKKKVAQKFANFFMANKTETAPAAAPSASANSGPFRQMQVSRYTVLAPVQRCVLADAARAALDAALTNSDGGSTYLALLRAGSHTPQTGQATPPPVLSTPQDNDDCLIIEEKEDDDDDDDSFPMGESVVFSESRPNPKKYRGKLLKFCENRRPPYWGTWTKKPAAVGPRNPFAKEQMFDYEYDSDDDWEEEEENGESLSDSEGEKDEEEDEQYEVDNDFFVPHGYLSDDEGQEKEDEDEQEDKEANEEGSDKEKTSAASRHNNQEKLKAKQAEFEKELKKQTKQLKPRVLGCLWLHQPGEQSGAAYDHLLRVLSGHSGVLCPALSADGATADTAPDCTAMGGMIPCMPPTPPASPERPSPPDQCETPMTVDSAAGTPGSVGGKTTYYKTFPEEAVPFLIRLLHGNRHGKALLVREFDQFWRLRQQGGGPTVKAEHKDEGAEEDNGPASTVPQTPSNALSKNIIRLKLSEIGEYKRCPDKGPLYNQVMWYVSAAIRDQHGVSDAGIPNQWTYCLAPKHDSSGSDARTPSASNAKTPGGSEAARTPSAALSKTPATNLITKFTKVLTEEEKAALNKKKEAPAPNPKAADDSSGEKASNDDDVIMLDDEEENKVVEAKVSSDSPSVLKGKRKTPKAKTAAKARTPAGESSAKGAATPGGDKSAGPAKKGSGKKMARPPKSEESAKKAISEGGKNGKKSPAAGVKTPAGGAGNKNTTPKSSRSIMSFLKRPSESKSPSRSSGAKGELSSSTGVAAAESRKGSGLNNCDSDCIVID